MMLANNINEEGYTDYSTEIAKEVRFIFGGLTSRSQKRFAHKLKAIDHSEAVAHLRNKNYGRAVFLLTNDDSTPKYIGDQHRMSTLGAARRGLSRQHKEAEDSFPKKKRRRHRKRASA